MAFSTYGGDNVFEGDVVVSSYDVQSYTGTQVDPDLISASLLQAISTIEIISGAFLGSADRIIPLFKQDAAWLKRAVIYQTLWVIDHPDSITQQNFASLSQDGQSVTNRDGLDVVLAPLAKRALKQCTWAKHGTIRLQSPFRIYTQVDATMSDNHGGWTKL